jgi:hypothetical protein
VCHLSSFCVCVCVCHQSSVCVCVCVWHQSSVCVCVCVCVWHQSCLCLCVWGTRVQFVSVCVCAHSCPLIPSPPRWPLYSAGPEPIWEDMWLATYVLHSLSRGCFTADLRRHGHHYHGYPSEGTWTRCLAWRAATAAAVYTCTLFPYFSHVSGTLHGSPRLLLIHLGECSSVIIPSFSWVRQVWQLGEQTAEVSCTHTHTHGNWEYVL